MKTEVLAIKEKAKRGEADIADGLRLAEIMKQAFMEQFGIEKAPASTDA